MRSEVQILLDPPALRFDRKALAEVFCRPIGRMILTSFRENISEPSVRPRQAAPRAPPGADGFVPSQVH